MKLTRNLLQAFQKWRVNSSRGVHSSASQVASRTVKIKTESSPTLDSLPKFHLYEPIEDIIFQAAEKRIFVNFFDHRVAAQFKEDALRRKFVLPKAQVFSGRSGQRPTTSALIGLWKGESRVVVWEVADSNMTKVDVQKEFEKFGVVLDVGQQQLGTGRSKFYVNFAQFSDARKALTEFNDPNLTPLPFNIGRTQEIVSSCPSKDERTAFNTVHIRDFVPEGDILLKLFKATQWLSVESCRLQPDNVLSLKFSTSRDARLFLQRASDPSKPYSLPSTAFSERIEAPLDRQKWLAIELGIARTILLRTLPLSILLSSQVEGKLEPTAVVGKLVKDFSAFGTVCGANFDLGLGFVDFLDIDSAVSAIRALQCNALEGYSGIQAKFHPLSPPSILQDTTKSTLL